MTTTHSARKEAVHSTGYATSENALAVNRGTASVRVGEGSMARDKRCSKCNQIKPLGAFHKDKARKDGHGHKCKVCVAIYKQAYRQTSKYREAQCRYKQSDKGRATQRKYRRTDKGRAAAKAGNRRYCQTDKGRAMRATKQHEYRNKYPEKVAARAAVDTAIRSGKLKRGPCEVCNTRKKVEAHHDDYTKPLDVRWLCEKHHRDAEAMT